MAYSKQTFTTGQVLTAAQQNQLESNVADHVHGRDAVTKTGISFPRSAKTSNFTAADTDTGELFDCSGTFTVNFDAAATLGNGWAITLDNNGSGVITIDPDSGAGETVDGDASKVVLPNNGVTVYSDGTNLHTLEHGGGGLRHLITKTAAADASIIFSASDIVGFKAYLLRLINIFTSGGALMRLKVGNAGGILSTSYSDARMIQTGATDTADTGNDSAATEIVLGGPGWGNAAAEIGLAEIIFSGMNNSAHFFAAQYNLGYAASNVVAVAVAGGGVRQAADTYTQIEISSSAGTFTGELALYGIVA